MILSSIRRKSIYLLSILVPLLGATAVQAASPFVVTASNATANELLVYSPSGQLIQALSTKGTGGATGNGATDSGTGPSGVYANAIGNYTVVVSAHHDTLTLNCDSKAVAPITSYAAEVSLIATKIAAINPV